VKSLFFIAVATLLVFGGGCTTTPSTIGIAFQNTTAPVRPEEQMQHRQAITPTKGGRACSYMLFGLIAWGDNSFGRAVREGDITTVSSVDTSLTGVPILGTGSVCTVVEGN
jgi:sulfite exporter TauE/SafE